MGIFSEWKAKGRRSRVLRALRGAVASRSEAIAERRARKEDRERFNQLVADVAVLRGLVFLLCAETCTGEDAVRLIDKLRAGARLEEDPPPQVEFEKALADLLDELLPLLRIE